ncbi:unnamed protein product [Coregonus sp. 'balchen']|nr:unnamed protein product [Coregonus sp. 'balchen']
MILSRETRKRGYNMKTFILLYFLGLTCKKVSAMDNSTKVYYMELRTEKSIPDNYISDILNNFKIDNPVSVDTFKITTVTVDGLLTIPGEVYYESLSNPQSAEYMALYNKLLPQMKALYSTLNSFDNIRITGFSQNKTNDVTTGTESTVTPTSRNFTVVLRQASEVWEGLYMCVFNPKSSNVTIKHKASATLDIALLPQIDISSTPQFPDCSMVQNEDTRILVTVQCEINNIAENYQVTWSTTHTESPLNNRTDVTSNSIIYRIDTTVSCRDSEKPTVTCTFMNILSQERNATVNIPVIYQNSNSCKADGDWPKAKAEFQAVLKCKDGIGKRKRLCLNNRYWNDEISNCNLAIGLGSVEKNAGDIFSRLNSSTFTPNSINTYANINASVSILSTMYNVINASQNNYTLNDAQLKDALSSSSNLLDGALKTSWDISI